MITHFPVHDFARRAVPHSERTPTAPPIHPSSATLSPSACTHCGRELEDNTRVAQCAHNECCATCCVRLALDCDTTCRQLLDEIAADDASERVA